MNLRKLIANAVTSAGVGVIAYSELIPKCGGELTLEGAIAAAIAAILANQLGLHQNPPTNQTEKRRRESDTAWERAEQKPVAPELPVLGPVVKVIGKIFGSRVH